MFGVKGCVELLNLGDAHELILYVPFYQQPDVAAQCRSHRLYLLSEDTAFSGTWFQISAQDVDGRGLARTILAQ